MNASKFWVRTSPDNEPPVFELKQGYTVVRQRYRFGIYSKTEFDKERLQYVVDLRTGHCIAVGRTLHDAVRLIKPETTAELSKDQKADIWEMWKHVIDHNDDGITTPIY